MNNDSRDNSTTKSKEVIYFYDKTKGLSTMPDDESDTSDLELDKSARRSICSEQGGQVKVIEPVSIINRIFQVFRTGKFSSKNYLMKIIIFLLLLPWEILIHYYRGYTNKVIFD